MINRFWILWWYYNYIIQKQNKWPLFGWCFFSLYPFRRWSIIRTLKVRKVITQWLMMMWSLNGRKEAFFCKVIIIIHKSKARIFSFKIITGQYFMHEYINKVLKCIKMWTSLFISILITTPTLTRFRAGRRKLCLKTTMLIVSAWGCQCERVVMPKAKVICGI